MNSHKSHIQALMCGAVAAAVIVGKPSPASAITCSATCTQVGTISLDGVRHDDADSGFVTGYVPSGFPSKSRDKGVWVYSHTFTAGEVADIATANAAGCEIGVSFWVSGNVLSSGSSMAVVDAQISTAAYIGGVEQILDTSDVNAAAPPTSPVSVLIDTGSLTATLVSAVAGDAVGVRGEGHAFAQATGTSSFDYASAYLSMAAAGTTGAPILQICLP